MKKFLLLVTVASFPIWGAVLLWWPVTPDFPLGLMTRPSFEVTPEDYTSWQAEAEDGVARAQYAVAQCLVFGLGVAPDPPSAIPHLRAAAAQGFVPAKYALARAYEHGVGVAIDEGAAAMWMREAAIDRLPEAILGLGEYYERGHGVPGDLPESLRLIQAAAETGLRAAVLEYFVFVSCYDVHLDDDDPILAEWLERLADAGEAAALYLQARRLETDEPPAASVLAQLVAASRERFAPAAYELGRLKLVGHGIDANPQEASALIAMAADAGYLPALGLLAKHAGDDADGKATRREFVEALRRRAARGDTESMVMLGRELIVDAATRLEGMDWLLRAALAGSNAARFELGRACVAHPTDASVEGIGPYVLKLAAAEGHPLAAYELAMGHQAGRDTVQSSVEANRWLTAASAALVPEAIEQLGRNHATGTGTPANAKTAAALNEMAETLRTEGADE